MQSVHELCGYIVTMYEGKSGVGAKKRVHMPIEITNLWSETALVFLAIHARTDGSTVGCVEGAAYFFLATS